MDKRVRKVTDLAQQQEETYRYWQSVSDSERMNATWQITLEMYRMKGLVQDAQGLQRFSLSAFNAHNVRYLIVGGYAYARYTEPRATKDLDLFLRPDPENAAAAYQALAEFGAHLADATVADFAMPGTIFQIGVAPFRVDLLCHIDGIAFDEAWAASEPALVDEEIPVRYISSDHLIANKLAAARPQDLVDVDKLRHAAEARERKPGA